MEAELVLCDTDVIIEYFNNNRELIELLESLGVENLVITPITRAEIQQGARNRLHLSRINKELDKFPVLDIDSSISIKFAELFERYILSNKCSIPDMLNAASAICYSIQFVTMNMKDFRYISGLHLIVHTIKPKKGGQAL